MQAITEKRVNEILGNARGKVVAVVGDVMLDRYFWGSVSRVSPEAPVPVIDLESETYHLGGAANVANNLQSLGINPLLCGVVGDDNSGKSFMDIALKNGINTSGLFIDTDRPTTIKTRIIGNNQQIARLDRELRKALSSEAEAFILSTLNKTENLAGLIFQDYNKGALTEPLIKQVSAFAKEHKIPVFVDPKLENFFDFKGTTVFKPNRKEAQQALSMALKTEDELLKAGKLLLQKLECENVLLTLGKDGMLLFESNGTILSVPTRARHVADVSGAGDTAIATLSAFMAGGATVTEAASIANYASGAVCEEPGIVSITPEALL
ncbi:MAG: bifunctional ADP-heptose synthase, partial [Bacteroidota bacterium]